jgi:DNA-binding beta-propeller fold protein YncE
LALSLGQVLIVLGPAVPTFDDEQARNLLGATGIPLQPLRTPAEAKAAHQDLVYNPQKDKWGTCGHGLTLQTGALAAYRGGASKRLWVLQPNAEIHTLQAAGEGLFAPDYVPRFPSTVLPDALDARLEVQVLNQSWFDLVAVDSVCQAAGLTSLSAAGPAKVTPVPGEFPKSAQQKFTIAYRADSAPVTLRFMVKDSEKGSSRFVLELTFSGTGLSTITSEFKRLAIDAQGAFALAEVPETAKQHPANQVVLVPPATLERTTAPKTQGTMSSDIFDMLRAGDAVPSLDGGRFYVPLAKPSNAASIELWSFDEVFSLPRKSAIQPPGGVFSVPNTLAVCKDRIYAMFGDKTLFELDYSMNVKSQRSYYLYNYIGALAATSSGDLFLLADKQASRFQDQVLLVERASGERSEFKLASSPAPWNLPAIAVSPDGKKVFICKDGGLLVVDTASGKMDNIDLPSAREEGDLTVSRDGASIYCAHVTRGYSIGADARRPSAGSALTVSRVRAGNYADTRTLSLPDVTADFGMTRGSTRSRLVGEKFNEPAALRLALSPDDRALFVSAGRTIYRIDAATFTLSPWTQVLALPCRLFHVKEDNWRKDCWAVLALGAMMVSSADSNTLRDYVGDGSTVASFRTLLYSVTVPKSFFG